MAAGLTAKKKLFFFRLKRNTHTHTSQHLSCFCSLDPPAFCSRVGRLLASFSESTPPDPPDPRLRRAPRSWSAAACPCPPARRRSPRWCAAQTPARARGPRKGTNRKTETDPFSSVQGSGGGEGEKERERERERKKEREKERGGKHAFPRGFKERGNHFFWNFGFDCGYLCFSQVQKGQQGLKRAQQHSLKPRGPIENPKGAQQRWLNLSKHV